MANKKEPESFSFYLLKGEQLAYPRGTHTPNCPYLVVGTPKGLTEAVMKAWFLEAIAPLVGQQAADELRAVFEKDETDRTGLFQGFIKAAIAFRK